MVLAAVFAALAGPARAAAEVAQGQEQDVEQEGGEGEGEVESEGGAEEGQTEEAAEEEGPPWTYQMARFSVAMLLFLGLGIGAAYYRFVVMRQRGEV